MKVTLDIYKLFIYLRGPESLLKKLAKDFSYFRVPGIAGAGAGYKLRLYLKRVTPEIVPEGMEACYYHSQFVQYLKGGVKYTDYGGEGFSIFNEEEKELDIYSENPDLLHEISYLAILSLSASFMEKKGLYRIHGLSFRYKNQGVIVLAPSGGGKTTLFTGLMENKNIKLFSDDMAIIDKKKRLYPFPLRIGIKENSKIASKIDKKFIYEMQRRKYGKKILIDTSFFKERISSPLRAKIIIVGKRWSSPRFKYEKASSPVIFRYLFRDFVIGLGLPQVAEYLNLKISFKNVPPLILKLIKRSAASAGIALKCRKYKVYLGSCAGSNRRGIIRLLQENI